MPVVYLVEDNDDVRELLTEMLASRHEVRSFMDGESALGALAGATPDVLLSDLGLPGIDGEDVARLASCLRPRPRLVLMSGDERRLARAASLADATLMKPQAIGEVLAAVEGRAAREDLERE